MAADKFWSMLGIARKAGKVESGAFAAEKAVRSGKAHLLILAENASDNTKKHFHDLCVRFGVPLAAAGSDSDLGRALGQESRMVACVTDEGLAAAVSRLYAEQNVIR
ncbi:MAG: ribosomal L7Ae/L30e/S12e/Gadd45 family protein [Lachnospiraceae bacterium]|nr:ribosomal L7Ae/L30e/S12e/Gadd45 family protein [Lachnospiraceae bacterium]